MIELNKDSFKKEVAKSDKPFLVDFWAPWCGPCRIIGPILEKLSEEYKTKIRMAKMNVDDNQEVAMKNDVRGIPCMIIFHKGNELDRIVGAFPEGEMRKKIDLILAKV